MAANPSIERQLKGREAAFELPLMYNARRHLTTSPPHHLMRTRHSFPSSVASILMLVAGLTACGGGEPEQLAGPCVVIATEPSFVIASVHNSVSGAPIAVVSLSGITRDGLALDLSLLPREASNVRVVGSSLECTAPCGFATLEGAFSFTVSAPGYVSRAVAASGAFSTHSGNGAGCPLYLSGGNRTTVSLVPSP